MVDGIGPTPGSMSESMGQEVTNLKNSQLNWRTITKGKRSRKPVTRNLNGCLKTASESPFVEASSWEQLSNGSGCVPIKKRRHMLRSPSPPSHVSLPNVDQVIPQQQTTSSEGSESLSDYVSPLNQFSDSNNVRKSAAEFGHELKEVSADKVSGMTGREVVDSDDFSGIALLAETACISDVTGGSDKLKGEVMEESSTLTCRTSIPTIPLEDPVLCPESEHLYQTTISQLEHKECPFYSRDSSAGSFGDQNNQCVSTKTSKIQRLHQDLCHLMEAAEEQRDSLKGLEKRLETKEGRAASWGSGNNGNDENGMPVILTDEGNSSLEANVKEISSEKLVREAGYSTQFNCSVGGNKGNHMLLGPTSETTTAAELKVKENYAEKFDCKEGSVNQFNFLKSGNEIHHVLFGQTDEATISIDSKVGVKQGVVIGHSDDGGNSLGSTMSKISERQTDLHEAPLLETSGTEIDIQLKEAGDSPKNSELPGNVTSLREQMFPETCDTLAVENTGSTSGDCSYRFSKNEDICSEELSASGQSRVFTDDKDEHDKVFDVSLMEVNDSFDLGSKDVSLQPDNDLMSSGEVRDVSILKDSIKSPVSDDCHRFDCAKDEDHAQLGGTEDTCQLQVDYDSPFEDGELRGSVELEDGEHECVDYESDGRVSDDSNSADYLGSVSVEDGSEDSQPNGKKHSFAVRASEILIRESGFGIQKESKENIEKIDSDGKKESNIGSRSADEPSSSMIVGKYDGSLKRKRCFDDHKDVFGDRRSYNGKYQSCVEAHEFDRKDAVRTPYRRPYKVGVSPSERNNSPDRLVTRYRSLGEHPRIKGNRQLNYWDRSHGHQSGCGGEDRQWSRSRSALADSFDRFVDLNSYENNQLKSIQQRFERRRSPVQGGDFYDVHGKVANTRSNRRRGSAESFSGDLREDYDEPVGDATAPFGYNPHYSSHRRKEGGCSLPSSKDPSDRRSRTTFRLHSPSWQSPRDRNLGAKRHAGSPGFRSSSSVERMRGPFNKSNVTADYGEGCVSPPRSRFSKVHNRSWANDRNFVSDPLRQRKSPARIFRRTGRLDSLASSVMLKSDDHCKPVRHSGRFLTAGDGNRDKLDHCNDRRVNDRSGMLRSVRHSDTTSLLRRSRPEARDDFEEGNCYNEEGGFRLRDRRGMHDFADYEEGVLSPPRGRLSPPRRYGRVDETNSGRGPWSPRRPGPAVVRRTRRLEPVHFSERLKSDDYF